MFCPTCEGEFREGIEVCPDCDVALVHELVEPYHDNSPLVRVFETADPAVLPLVKSLLEGSEIPFLIKGEETLGLFPARGVGLAVDPKARAAQVLVAEERADEVRALLQDLGPEAGNLS